MKSSETKVREMFDRIEMKAPRLERGFGGAIYVVRWNGERRLATWTEMRAFQSR